MIAPTEGRETDDSTRDSVNPGSGADLTVVYDDRCPLCRRCRRWVMGQPQLVSFRFVAASEPWVGRWLGHLLPVGDELVVIDRAGAVWIGPDAFIVCLWGLERYRALAGKLQWSVARPVAKRAFHLVSAGRGLASLVVPEAVAGGGPECDERSCRD